MKLNTFLAEWMTQLDQHQISKVFKDLDRENQQLTEQITEPGDDLYTRRFELVLGSLTSEQQKLILDHKSLLKKSFERRLQRRLQSRSFLDQLYTSNQDQQERTLSLKRFFDSQLDFSGSKEERQQITSLIIQVLDLSNPAQKDHLKTQLQRLIWLIETLQKNPN